VAAGVAAAAAAVVIIRKQLCHTEKSIKTIVITGGCGNLATKLATHLLATRGEEVRVVLIEHPLFVRPEVIPEGAELVVLDLGSPSALKLLRETLHGVDTVVHFSAVNPYPNASWAESAASMDHSFNVLLASQKGKVRRFVLASSNHVMGGYKDDETWTSTDTTETTEAPPRTLVRGGGGLITPQLKVRVGTKVKAVERCGDAVAYGAAKLAAERLCASLAAAAAAAAGSPSSTSFVALRIGWCQPGANLPSTLSAEGAPPIFLNPLATDNSKEERPFSEPLQAAAVAEAGGASLSSSSEAAASRAPEAPEAPAAEDAPCGTDNDEAWFKGMVSCCCCCCCYDQSLLLD
jgi:nucleoside-diphosphate-sugar epimerase